MTKALNTDNEKIELTPEQQNPGLVTPESFEIICGGTAEYEDESVSGQRENSPLAQKNSDASNPVRGSNYLETTTN